MNVSVAEELAIKWYEMIQLGLPSTALASFFGPLNLILIQRDLKQTQDLFQTYIPQVIQ